MAGRKRKKRPKSRDGSEELMLAAAWYRREEWERLRAVAADPEDLEDTYDKWLRNAQRLMVQMGGKGIRLVKVDVGADELCAWCRQQSVPVDSAARAGFASEKALRQDQGR